MKRLPLLSLLLLACALTQAHILWLQREYDFGAFHEEEGPRRGEVKMVNTGPQATVINRVKSTCGCTVAGFTEGLIEPGDTASVWFTYNPTGRPGRFEKHIKVYTGTDNAVTSITLKGTVIGSRTSLQGKYPVAAGPMRLSASGFDLGKTVWGRSRHEYISGYNQSEDTLHIAFARTPIAVSLGAGGKTVPPGDLFTIGMYLNTRDVAEPGPYRCQLRIYPQEGDTTQYAVLNLSADIAPDTSGLSEQQLRDAPFCLISPETADLGVINRKDKSKKFTLTITNDGRTPLRVSRVCIPGSQALHVLSLPASIPPGKRGEIKTELLPQFLSGEGAFVLEAQVLSNDPLHPSRTIRLAGILK